ncbi:histidinol-phosphate transaminase [Cellulomonas sp. zg-ZUI222]|uniref:Aromatic amino acid aminotransferase n=1 Tax=Cellulomonas wangleii TaxID=2816956 RepID=A0ABX8D440_9CELL|nr:histidinol-phosphate transaminase [Cellulomonas wangleii]MBO0919681.1 histidinol-phosphate transaminase [Cellulomonas wangleii]MBO0923892.1 histidinol-phosphate transaminase [Cellulomonas wangleii]MBO0924174.1 histidinol-phosphate transaminase [Cellulomonas wangleii]QVI62194.1 histidinol-phosphate transaminase [Cellulomonas wangleii]
MLTDVSRVPLRRALADLPAYVPGARAAVGAAAYKLSSNENPYPPLPSVVAAIADAAVDVNRYPDMYATELTEGIAHRLAVVPESVVAGTGSVAVLGHVLTAVCEAGDQVVLPWRSFEAYPIAVTLAHAEQVRVPVLADGRLDLPAMAAAVTDRTRVVLVCTPNNPTGPAVRDAELRDFLAAVPRDVLVVLDEAYVEFVRDPQAPDALALFAEHPNVVLLRTFSKAYGLAGLRVGYAVARPRLAAAIRTASTPFGVSHVAQLAAIASLRAEQELLVRVEAVVAERTRMLEGLRAQGWAVPDSQANFVWLALGDRAVTFAERCARAGVLVRPFAGDGVRVSVGEREATDIFLEVAQAHAPR